MFIQPQSARLLELSAKSCLLQLAIYFIYSAEINLKRGKVLKDKVLQTKDTVSENFIPLEVCNEIPNVL